MHLSRNQKYSLSTVVKFNFAAIILLILTGCGTLYELQISAKNPNQSKLQGTYVLIPARPDIDINSAEFHKYSGQIERGLADTALQRLAVTELARADMAIVVDYGVGEPQDVGVTTKVPMFQRRGRVIAEAEAPRSTGQSGGGTSSSTRPPPTEAPPVQELVGTQSYTFVRTQYWRDLSLRAVTFDRDREDPSSIKQTGMLWSVYVETQGSSEDLDEVLPVMVASARPYIGVDSKDTIAKKMNGVDRRIKEIRGTDP